MFLVHANVKLSKNHSFTAEVNFQIPAYERVVLRVGKFISKSFFIATSIMYVALYTFCQHFCRQDLTQFNGAHQKKFQLQLQFH